ncbi:hypothetical protein KJ742_01415 [Patescibacteria group bacterium]|nr:hypothetical protein [Patescibacteria group bacterium]MBU1682583.1 hypothetical protein [Patescibacteria group bacterium]
MSNAPREGKESPKTEAIGPVEALTSRLTEKLAAPFEEYEWDEEQQTTVTRSRISHLGIPLEDTEKLEQIDHQAIAQQAINILFRVLITNAHNNQPMNRRELIDELRNNHISELVNQSNITEQQAKKTYEAMILDIQEEGLPDRSTPIGAENIVLINGAFFALRNHDHLLYLKEIPISILDIED